MRDKRLSWIAVLCLVLASSAATAIADDGKKWQPEPQRGGRLSQTLCSGCHVVSSDQDGSVIAGIPSFHAIANMPDRTAQYLRNTLIKPHAPMPDVQLTEHEIGDIISYFEQLRASQLGTPEEPPKNSTDNENRGKSKPKSTYPSPS